MDFEEKVKGTNGRQLSREDEEEELGCVSELLVLPTIIGRQ